MNEQFRKLLSRATELADEEYGYDGSDYADIVQEKFAELIVKECMQVANEYQNRGGNCYVDNMIAKHFGVEE